MVSNFVMLPKNKDEFKLRIHSLNTNLEVGEFSAVPARNDVQWGADDETQLKLVEGPSPVASQTQTPDLEHCFQVKQQREKHLKILVHSNHRVDKIDTLDWSWPPFFVEDRIYT